MGRKSVAKPMPLATRISKLLSPWRFRKPKLLGGSVLEPMNGQPLDETLWCQWDPFEDDWEEVTRALECFELLGVVAQIDTAIFRGLASELFEFSVDERYEVSYTRIGIMCPLSEYLDLAELSVMFGWDIDGEKARDDEDRSEPTRQFESVKDELLAIMREKGITERESTAVRFSAENGEFHWKGEETNKAFQLICAVAQRFHERASSATDPMPFKLSCVDLSCHSKWTNDEFLEGMMRFKNCGVDIYGLELNGLELQKPVDPVLMMRVMDTYVQPQSSTQNDVGRGLNQIGLFTSIDRQLHRAIGSALMFSTSVRLVSVATMYSRQDPELARALWKALALALFSSKAANCVESFHIKADSLTDEEVAVVQEVVQHENPLIPGLYPYPVSASSNQLVSLRAGCGVWLQGEMGGEPDVESSPQTFTLESDQSDLLVLYDSGGAGLSVLLPGCGPCWVHRSSIIAVSHVDRYPFQQREPRYIQHVMLRDINPASASPTVALLKVIGKGIERLEFDAELKPVIPSSWLREVIAACPNMHELTIAGSKIMGVDEILDACEVGALKLTMLAIERCPIKGSMRSFFRLFNALSNANHPLAKTLKSLTISTSGLSPVEKIEWERLLEAWVAMLECNSVLRLSRWHTFGPVARRKHLETLFAKFEGQILVGREGPLETRAKLAFISTLSVNHVDIASDVLSRIFKYAAPRETRSCQYFT